MEDLMKINLDLSPDQVQEPVTGSGGSFEFVKTPGKFLVKVVKGSIYNSLNDTVLNDAKRVDPSLAKKSPVVNMNAVVVKVIEGDPEEEGRYVKISMFFSPKMAMRMLKVIDSEFLFNLEPIKGFRELVANYLEAHRTGNTAKMQEIAEQLSDIPVWDSSRFADRQVVVSPEIEEYTTSNGEQRSIAKVVFPSHYIPFEEGENPNQRDRLWGYINDPEEDKETVEQIKIANQYGRRDFDPNNNKGGKTSVAADLPTIDEGDDEVLF
jgi:hypothetical protein